MFCDLNSPFLIDLFQRPFLILIKLAWFCCLTHTSQRFGICLHVFVFQQFWPHDLLSFVLPCLFQTSFFVAQQCHLNSLTGHFRYSGSSVPTPVYAHTFLFRTQTHAGDQWSNSFSARLHLVSHRWFLIKWMNERSWEGLKWNLSVLIPPTPFAQLEIIVVLFLAFVLSSFLFHFVWLQRKPCEFLARFLLFLSNILICHPLYRKCFQNTLSLLQIGDHLFN